MTHVPEQPGDRPGPSVRRRKVRGMPKELDIFQMYMEEMAAIEACGREENARLAEAAAGGDDGARNRLVEGNLRYVLELSRDFLGRGVAAGDLAQEANLALLLAAAEYDPAACDPFEEFLAGRVKDALTETIKRHQTEEKAGKRILERVNMLQDVSKVMAEELGREATVPELAERLKMTEDEVREIMKTALDALHALGE